jgi:uncharacterized protein (TIRG00374 family)
LSTKSDYRRRLRLGVGLLFATLFAWLVFREVSAEAIARAFVGVRFAWIWLAVVAFSVGYSSRIERWRLMLLPENPQLTWAMCAGPLMAGFAANNVLPFRAGDVLRSVAFTRELGVGAGAVLATLVIERLLDLFIMIAFLGIVALVVGTAITGLTIVEDCALVAGAVGILLLLIVPGVLSTPALFVGRSAARLSPRFGKRLQEQINRGLCTLQHLGRGHTLLNLILWSALTWLAEGCVFRCAAAGLPTLATPSAGWLALPLGTLATLIPSTPGYVGTFDYVVSRAMTTLGNGPAAATAYGLLVHSLLWLPSTAVGGLYLAVSRLRRVAGGWKRSS